MRTVIQGSLRECLLFAILLILTTSGSHVNASPQQTGQGVSLTEWAVPTLRSGPWGLTLDQSGTCCWFVEYYGNNIAHFNPQTGYFQEWTIPTRNSDPYSIAITSVGRNVMVWGTEFGSGKIFAFSPDSGKFTEYSLHSTGIAYISIEPQSGINTRVWFTETTSNINGEFIYDSATGNVTYYRDSFPTSVGGGAYSVHASSASIWFAGFTALVRWDRASAQYTIWPLPNHNATLGRFITFDAFGQPWYTQGVGDAGSHDNFVGVLRGNTIQEWRIPNAGANPRGISINPLTQQPWIAEQSSLQGNATVANLSDYGNGTLFSSTPITAQSRGTATILSPTITQASATNHTVTPSTRSIMPTEAEPFVEYALGPTLTSDTIIDASGNVWISEPATNKIAKLSVTGSDYSLTASPQYVSSAQRTSVHIPITINSVSGYAGDVTFAVTNLPPGLTSSFDPNTVHVPSGANATTDLVIHIANANLTTDLIVISGSDGTIAHSISIIITVTNSTGPVSPQSQANCLIPLPIYQLDVALLSALLIDVLIGGIYIGLPLGAVSQKLFLVRRLSRRTWLIISLVAPTAVALGISISLLLC